jgi:hypothetical protein
MKIKDTGLGNRAVSFYHNQTNCYFAITTGGVIANINIVNFLLYRKFSNLESGRSILIRSYSPGNREHIKVISNRIDSYFTSIGRVQHYFSLIVHGSESTLHLPCVAWLIENGYQDVEYETLVRAIKQHIDLMK